MMTSNAAFKKQVRELAAHDGIPYSEARTRLLAGPSVKSATAGKAQAPRESNPDRYSLLIGRAILARAYELAAADQRFDREQEAWARAHERTGRRIVEAGQTGRFDDDGKVPWEIKDWRTGELLAEGVSSYEDMAWDESWVDITEFDDDSLNAPRTALRSIIDQAPARLYRVIEQLTDAVDEKWSDELAEWIRTLD
jgi:hypothetical protein